jgi:glycosyltransferase involved in cell wall biosynthesis
MPRPEALQGLTVAMIARDEEGQIGAALASVEGLAGRVVVLDTGSADGTAEAARAAGAEVFERPDFPGFGPAKQEVLDRCSTEWVLILDADERVTGELAASIRDAIATDGPEAGFRVRRRNHVLGRPMTSMGLDRDEPLRLVRRERARVSDTLVHEVLEVDGPTGELRGALDHFTLTSLDGYLRKIDLYTTLELQQRPRPLRVWHLAFVMPGTFIKWYLFRGGFRDGVPGLVWAGLTAIGRFIRDMKVWIAQQPGHEEGPPASTDGPA